ncbi:MAG: Methionyl-tRNA formyltransferase [Pedosphaera sp.]|nr:Methionyl-tRNA formyltransferase [Pedosphaera sp.]
MSALRIIFMGTAELACASLVALAQQPDFLITAVVTQPDRPKGRDLKLQPSPVKETALSLRLPVLQPERARKVEFIEELRQLQPDLIVVAAYGQILPQAMLDLPPFGSLNVHTSLLPKYRGAAPIQWAILDGESETGVTIMKMDAGLDTGDILTQQTTPIHVGDNSQTLHDRLAQLGAALLVPTIREHIAGKIILHPQPTEGISYARKIAKEDGRLDWTQPAQALWNRARAFTPWPGVFTHLPGQPHSHLLKIWQAEIADRSGQPGEILQADKSGILVACGQQSLRLLQLQREGGRRMSAQEFLTGHPLKPGDKLG